jgi:hypothetical protein
MTLPHAIYGSATGLGDYRILASTAPFDDRLRSTIIYYANVEGSARSTPFAPIFSFYALGENLWAFSRTVCLGPTPRGNDYLVHAIVLDAAALARLDYKPFALADAHLFASKKPAEGSVLKPLSLDSVAGVGRWAFGSSRSAEIASCLRVLSRGPLRLRMTDDAAEVCREIHESLPPDDRLSTTFCTRFSYGRSLAFGLAAFAPEDESRVRETAPNATLVDFPPPGTAAPDLFGRWTSEIRGQADFDLIGLSVLRDVREAFALIDGVRQLRLWTSHEMADVQGLEKAAALVLRKENRGREVVQGVLPGALAVDLVARVRAGESFDEGVRLCSEIEPPVRRAAVRWLRELKTTPAEVWMAEMLLLLTDGSLAEVAEGLKRVQLAPRPFLATLLARMRDRFGAEGASVAAAAAPLLAGDRDALLAFVRAMEETASRDSDRARQTAWLLAIVRDVYAKAGIAPAIPARIILNSGLLSSVTDAELETFGPAFFVLEEKLANVLATTPAADRPALYRALANVTQTRLREGWTPASPAAAEVLRRVLSGGAEAGAETAHLTVIAFLATAQGNADPHEIVRVIEHVARSGVTESQASLLLRALQSLAPGSEDAVTVHRGTLVALYQAARRRPPQNVWSRLSWHLRMRTLSEVVG